MGLQQGRRSNGRGTQEGRKRDTQERQDKGEHRGRRHTYDHKEDMDIGKGTMKIRKRE